jgi:hypothetical protein
MPLAMTVNGDGLLEECVVEDLVSEFLIDSGRAPTVGMALLKVWT